MQLERVTGHSIRTSVLIISVGTYTMRSHLDYFEETSKTGSLTAGEGRQDVHDRPRGPFDITRQLISDEER